jgi:glycosyltransferase involved in cell wall biosynthesis
MDRIASISKRATHPRITIITPSLNQGQFIESTIQSILAQNYPNLEYIVMDGGSKDNTIEILKRYSNQLRWVSEKDKGQTNAINKGLRMAGGEIFAYLNADDVLLPGALFKVAQVFSKNPQAMWVTGRCKIVDENNVEIRRFITAYKNFWLKYHSRSGLLITDYISQPATFWRADVFHELGPLEESLHYAMDYEYWLRLISKYPLMVIPEYLAMFRIHEQSKNTNAGHKDVYIDEERIVIGQHTDSKLLQTLHDIHRWLMTSIYTLVSRA